MAVRPILVLPDPRLRAVADPVVEIDDEVKKLARDMLAGRGGSFESGELAIREQGGRHAVPTSLFTRWTSDAGA